MNYLFYFFGIFAILWEILTIAKLEKVHRFVMRMRSDEIKNTKMEDRRGIEIAYAFFIFGYLFWNFAGLLTSQWLLFLLLIVISFALPKKFIFLRGIDAVISVGILLFAMINQFHLKIDLLAFIMNYF